jgi:hypothetical protein
VDEKSRDVVSGLKHNNRLNCHRGIVSQWMFQVGLNVTVDETWVDKTWVDKTWVDTTWVDETWVDVSSRHRARLGLHMAC